MSEKSMTRGERGQEPDTVYRVEDASVTFDMERGHSKVLDEVSFDIHRNEILGIVGESGSGKSMFASSLLDAVVEPGVLSGDITYYPPDGDPVRVTELSKKEMDDFRWDDVAMVFQGAMSSFNPTLSIRGHFEETLKAHEYNVSEGMERARQLISDLYMQPKRVLDSYPHELSGGMRQRTLIALSLLLDPDVLVMDEPTAALDLLMQRSILTLIQEIKEKYDLTIVFITHDLPLVSELADRIAVMYAFEFVEIGTTEEILNAAAHPYTRALLKATPNVNAPIETMQPVEGSSPDPVNVPSGCSYHPRCPLADETCRSADPGSREVTETHSAACFHWEDAEEAIPFETDVNVADTTESSGEESSGELVRLDDVEVHFESKQRSFIESFFNPPDTVRAVDGVSLTITENDVVAFVGESGCGKTTLGKTSVGLQRPTGGSVKYRGQDIWEAKKSRIWEIKNSSDSEVAFSDIRRSLQIIHQDPGSSLNPNRKVMKILEEPMKKWHKDLDRDDREARILGMLEHVGMTPPEDYAGRYPHQLSGGEKQRIALIRALLVNPDLILADEAVSALDVSLRIEMMDLFLDLQEQFNTSFFFVSHDLSNARYITEKAGGRIGVMYLGEVVEIGPAEKIINDPRHPYTQTLRWATPSIHSDVEEETELSLRKIDIPDPIDPPSGCRFHTRCPKAREACVEETPETVDLESDHSVACFREIADHSYWDSEPLGDTQIDQTEDVETRKD